MKKPSCLALAMIGLGSFSLCYAQGQPAPAAAGSDFDKKYLDTNSRAKAAAASGDTAQAAPARIQKQIDLDVVDKDLREVMEEIGRKVGRNILVAPGVQEQVTIKLRDIPWTDAVRIIAQLTRCEIEEAAENVLLLTQPPKVTIQFNDANVRTVLQLLAAYSGKNIIISPQVTGRVALDLKDVRWDKALRSIVKTVGPYVVVEDGPDLLRVVPQESIERQLETNLIRLKYVRPPARYQAIPPASSGQGGGGGQNVGAQGGGGGRGLRSNVGNLFAGNRPNRNSDNPEETFTLFRALRGIIDATPVDNDSVQYDAETNSILIRATKPTTDEIRRIIEKVDVEPTQLFIEIRFISTTNRNFLETGLKFNGGDLMNGLQLSGPFPPGQQVASNLFFRDPFLQNQNQQQQQQQGQNQQLQNAITNPVGAYPFLIGEGFELFTENFNIPAVLDFSGLNATLNMIDSIQNSRILQEPSLFTLDNQPAVIFVGDNVPFAQTQNNNDINGNVQQGVQAGDGSPIAVGFSLYVEPHIVPETDKIILTVIPRVNRLSGTTSPIAGFERFQFSNTTFIDLPRTSEQAVVTKIMLQDGQTAVIGGLLTDNETQTKVAIPFLSDIPLIGPLFINKVNMRMQQNLVIFISPTIVRTQAQGRSLFKRTMDKQRKYDGLFQVGSYLDKREKVSANRRKKSDESGD